MTVLNDAARAAITGGHLGFSPITHAGSIEWTCNGAITTIDNKYRPTPCRD